MAIDNKNNPKRDDDCGCENPRNANQSKKASNTAETDRQKQMSRDTQNESEKTRGQNGNENTKGRTSQVDYTREKTGTTGTDPKRHANMIEDDTSTDIDRNDQLGGDPARNDDERRFNKANKTQRPQDSDAL